MTTHTIPESTPIPQQNGPLPPLEPGDHLTAAEFERRYDAMPGLTKAELINGVVHMPSPVRMRNHAQPHIALATWLGVYQASTPGVLAADNPTARFPGENRPQPDLILLIAPDRNGQARISGDDYVEGAPELVAEVSASSVAIDLHEKLELYRQNGVREYVVWRVLDRQLDWFVLRGERYEPRQPDESGLLRSEVFPGLWLDVAALLRGDLSTVLTALQRGLASPEHAAFVARLNPPAS
jgi:Uma2 family endonuclease